MFMKKKVKNFFYLNSVKNNLLDFSDCWTNNQVW